MLHVCDANLTPHYIAVKKEIYFESHRIGVILPYSSNNSVIVISFIIHVYDSNFTSPALYLTKKKKSISRVLGVVLPYSCNKIE